MLSARADMVPKIPRDFGFIDSPVLYTTSLKARRQSHQGALCLEGEQGTDDLLLCCLHSRLPSEMDTSAPILNPKH